MEVAASVRALMGRKRVTQADLARATGISQSVLSRVLADQRDLSVDELHLIAQYLGVDAGRIIDNAMQHTILADG